MHKNAIYIALFVVLLCGQANPARAEYRSDRVFFGDNKGQPVLDPAEKEEIRDKEMMELHQQNAAAQSQSAQSIATAVAQLTQQQAVTNQLLSELLETIKQQRDYNANQAANLEAAVQNLNLLFHEQQNLRTLMDERLRFPGQQRVVESTKDGLKIMTTDENANLKEAVPEKE